MRGPIGGASIDPDCLEAVDAAARLAESLGHTVEEMTPQLPSIAELQEAIGATTQPGITGLVEARLQALGRPLRDDDLEPFTHEMLIGGRGYSALASMGARKLFYKLGTEMASFQQRFDVLLSPTLGEPPLEIGVLTLQDPTALARIAPRFSPFTMLFNSTGQPSMSVPLHWSAAGLPIGTMWTGRYGDEASLLRLAGQLEEARPWWDRRPPI
jgi:Asp-tRNA(Asn)/Glu-tRNA(Gln) amidotransferase A subunit family amidase